jgi:hypothetical protein
MDAVVAVDVRAPHRACAAFGQLRSRVLDALLLGLPARVPASLRDELLAWAAEQVGDARGVARGVDLPSVPHGWVETLGWSGVPLAARGELLWDRDLRMGTVDVPTQIGECLLLPPPDRLAELSGLAIKPLRNWVGRHLGCRLQAAPGLRLFLWADRALVVSHLDLPIGGFLYGPAAGSRASLAVSAGGWQVVTW